MTNTRVSALTFSDIFVHASPAECRYKQTPGSSPQALPREAWQDLAVMRRRMESMPVRSSFRLHNDGVSYRGERMETLSGLVFVLRRLARGARAVSELGFPAAVLRSLLSAQFNYGLVLFTGPTGAGKSTAACALLTERLRRYGGLAWTVENPIEIDLQGPHGEGFCYQLEAESDEDFGRLIAATLRGGAPQIIFIGEIRESSAAAQALRAAASGYLVIATMHASDIVPALERVLSLARVYEGDAAQALLADGMAASVHIRARFTGGSNGEATRRQVEVKALIGGESNVSVREKIRRGELFKLAQDLEQQRTRMMMNLKPDA